MGWAITNREHDQDMALIVEMGVTAVRLAHYQHAQHFYDLCDQQRHRRLGRDPAGQRDHREPGVHRQRAPADDRAHSPELQPPGDRLLERRQRAAQRRRADQHAARRIWRRRSRPKIRAACRPTRIAAPATPAGCRHTPTWSATTNTSAGTPATTTSSAPGPTACTRRGPRSRSRSASTARARRSPSTPTTRRCPSRAGRSTRGVPGAAARGDLEADRGAAVPVGQVHLEHVRFRGRQPQRGRHARPQRQGHGQL